MTPTNVIVTIIYYYARTLLDNATKTWCHLVILYLHLTVKHFAFKMTTYRLQVWEAASYWCVGPVGAVVQSWPRGRSPSRSSAFPSWCFPAWWWPRHRDPRLSLTEDPSHPAVPLQEQWSQPWGTHPEHWGPRSCPRCAWPSLPHCRCCWRCWEAMAHCYTTSGHQDWTDMSGDWRQLRFDVRVMLDMM